MNRFVVNDKGLGKYALFVPGWATGTEIFENTKVGYNHIYVENFDPFTFTDEVGDFIAARKISKISFTGFSMGAAALLHSLHKIGDAADNVVLIGLRKEYPEEVINIVRQNLVRNRQAYLYRFYSDMFSAEERDALALFKERLMRKYIASYSPADLMKGLDYLESAKCDFGMAGGTKVKFIYGTADKIVSEREVDKYRKEADNMNRIDGSPAFGFVEGAGHAPFIKNPKILDI